MNGRQAEEYLLGLELFGMRFGLDRMHRLMTVLGMPQRRFASIHVVGSNGKSSTVRMIAAMLERHGVRTGSYTSPHLRSFTERIEVGEEQLSEAELGAAVGQAAHAATLVDRTAGWEGDRVTQFEALTAAAYHELARRRVEVAVVEAGLGGRYDATNVIPSRVQVLSGISLEHTRWLGSTRAAIAEEKLAVVPDHGCLVVADDLDPEVEAVVSRVAAERHARLVRASAPEPLVLRARGEFQRRNFALARAGTAAFLGELDEQAVALAAAEVELPGRLQVIGEAPPVLLDGAHNPDAAGALAQSVGVAAGGRPLTAVIAVLDDKDAEAMLSVLLPLCERVVYTAVDNPRSLPPAALAAIGERLDGPPAQIVGDARAALERARGLAGAGGAVLATGSLHLVGELLREPGGARASWL